MELNISFRKAPGYQYRKQVNLTLKGGLRELGTDDITQMEIM